MSWYFFFFFYLHKVWQGCVQHGQVSQKRPQIRYRSLHCSLWRSSYLITLTVNSTTSQNLLFLALPDAAGEASVWVCFNIHCAFDRWRGRPVNYSPGLMCVQHTAHWINKAEYVASTSWRGKNSPFTRLLRRNVLFAFFFSMSAALKR